ncbi:hypothetical protein CSM33_000837 [Salmonella enterica subsp. diarizonae]|nr:hypothetical protein [Salmonella enterica subsp. diarizonae serovar 47:k:z35]EDQ3840067.1 hypothetical protein [Salmonella enterica subsp. enterica serovar Bareilly]EDQ3854171.1 hypothetical protein [Salmonella enterica subsp. diarizonae]EDQ4422768.1 hypothetical protein [Salmonella enterica subsp. salamae]EDR1378923.1 hypothetical protein [Salmonella enterica subsp. diarizonae serovar 61:r:z53]EDR4606527.1 hypothetical protein [Salmonella enterica]EDT4348948.1 hypothetical protein [Salmon
MALRLPGLQNQACCRPDKARQRRHPAMHLFVVVINPRRHHQLRSHFMRFFTTDQ